LITDKKEITCIICPIGCKILVRSDGTRFELIDGNKCKKGIDYARTEALDPRRMLTSSVLVKNGEWPLVSVKSSEPIPKEKVFSVLKEIKRIAVNAPVKSGQTIIKNVSNTRINIVATKSIEK
jgi:CxxC motif-containing protein